MKLSELERGLQEQRSLPSWKKAKFNDALDAQGHLLPTKRKELSDSLNLLRTQLIAVFREGGKLYPRTLTFVVGKKAFERLQPYERELLDTELFIVSKEGGRQREQEACYIHPDLAQKILIGEDVLSFTVSKTTVDRKGSRVLKQWDHTIGLAEAMGETIETLFEALHIPTEEAKKAACEILGVGMTSSEEENETTEDATNDSEIIDPITGEADNEQCPQPPKREAVLERVEIKGLGYDIAVAALRKVNPSIQSRRGLSKSPAERPDSVIYKPYTNSYIFS